MNTVKELFKIDSKDMKIDILVNNAGTELVKGLEDITPEDFSKVYDLNVGGALLMAPTVLPYLTPKGRIINISSIGSRSGFANLGLYCSSKAALEGLTRCWAAQLGTGWLVVL
jgi:3-oxoacyl-[acyl-carrier protein] reductase